MLAVWLGCNLDGVSSTYFDHCVTWHTDIQHSKHQRYGLGHSEELSITALAGRQMVILMARLALMYE